MASFRQIVCLVASGFVPFAALSLNAQSIHGKDGSRTAKEKQTLPLVFEANQGQFPSSIGFVGKTEHYTVAVEPGDLRFALPAEHGTREVVLSFEGSQAAAPAGMAEAPFRTNYFIGSDPSAYRTGIKNYTRIGLPHLYPGVDAEFYAKGNSIEHDFLLAPGANPELIAMRIATEGQAAVVSETGDLLIAAGEGELRLKRPVAYQVGQDGKRMEVSAAFAVSGDSGEQQVRFRLGAYDHTRALVIDPVIQYASFFDGKAGSTASALVTDTAGNAYLTGSTVSLPADFGVPAGSTSQNISGSSSLPATSPTATSAVFVARFNALGSATPVAWLSYFGSTGGNSRSTSIALQALSATPTVVVGGATTAIDFPVTIGEMSTVATPLTAVQRGFVTSLVASTGALQASTYIDSGTTTGLIASGAMTAASTEVDGVAVDTLGNVYAVGTANGSVLPVTATTALPVPASVVNDPSQKGFVYELTSTLATGSLVSYVNGSSPGTTRVSSVAVDALFNVYVGGYTAGIFPKAGVYSSANMNAHNADLNNDAFAAEILPGTVALPASLVYSTWISGGGDDELNAIVPDGAGNMFLFGQTTSSGLPAATSSTSAVIPPILPPTTFTPVTGSFPTKTGTATTSGFAAKINAIGQPLVVTYLGGTGDDVVTSGTVAVTGQVYAAGRSSSAPSMSYSSATLLPATQDPTVSGEQHGFVMQLDSNLTTVNSIANIGGAAGPDTVVGVGRDATGKVYVGGNIGSTSAYTTPSSFETSRSSTSVPSSAYFAQIDPTTSGPSPVTLTAVTYTQTAGTCAAAASQPATAVGCPDPIGVPNASGTTAGTETVTYFYTLSQSTVTASPLTPVTVVVTIPTVTYLTYGMATVTDTTVGAAPLPAGQCVTGAASVVCTIAVPQTQTGTSDTLVIALPATLPTQPPAGVTKITVQATATTPLYTDQTVAEISNVVQPAQLTMTAAVTSPASATVFTTNTGATSPNTVVTYTFTITNAAGAGTSNNTSFSLNTGAATAPLNISSVTTAAAGASCTTSGCTGITIAPGTSVTVVVTGTYADAALAGGASATAQAVTGTASSFLSTAVASTPAVTVQRGVHLTITSSVNTPPNSQTNFNLKDAVSYTIGVANAGPSGSSGADTLSVTLPAAFTPSLPAGSPFTCSGTTCTATLAAIAAGATNSADGVSGQPLIIPGTFLDNSANAGILATPVLETFSVTGTLHGDFESGNAASGYTSSAPANVVRTANLAISAASLTPPATTCAGGNPACVYMQNAGDILDQVGYSFAVNNAGPNVSVNTQVTITLPFAPVNPAGAAHPVTELTLTPTAATPDFGAKLSCTYSGSTTNKITCTGGNLPVGNSVLTVAGSLVVDSGTVPATTAFVTTASAPGTVAVTQSANGTPGASTLPTVEIDRAAHLILSKAATATGSTPATPVDLDENSPSLTKGVNDTVTVTTAVGSAALNSAPGVVFTDTLPAYFRFTQVPTTTPAAVTCTVGGAAIAANYTTTGTPTTMTCNLGTITPGNGKPSSGGTAAVVGTPQATVSYTGKFIDSGTGADITGATAASKVSQLTASVGTANATLSNTVDPYAASNDATSSSSIAVQRLVHMIVRKTRNTVNVAPASYTFSYPNLDSEPGKASFGANDEIEYEVAFANGGVNKALGVQFSDTLPPYFTLVNAYLVNGSSTAPDTGGVPANQMANSLACYLGTSASGTALTLPYATGASSQTISCTYGTTAAPLALASGPSTTAALDNATAKELVYQGKFQDNAVNGATVPDDIPAGVNAYSVTSAVGDATTTANVAVDNGPATDRASTALSAYLIQRAAHLALVVPAAPVTDTAGNTLTKAADGTFVAAQAEPSTVTGATPVFNCVRYKTYLQNAGPNAARQPQLTVTLPAGLNLTSTPLGTTGTPNADAALPSSCAYGASAPTTVQGSSLIPLTEATGTATPSLVVDLDGYFGLNTLAGVNSLGGFAPTYTALTDPGIADSIKSSPFTAVKGTALTVVNTPYGSNFALAPFSTTGTQPVALTLASVGVPGITSVAVSSTTTATLPRGTSPVPGSTATVNLYKAGTSSPQFYSLGTTAGTVSGNTNLCISNPTAGAALADGFAKPERVLLWGLANVVASPAFGTVPNITSSPTGDVTSSVLPLGAASYVQPGGPLSPYDVNHTTLPAKQPQPLRVCGNVSGLANIAAPAVFAVLEPVNFAPVITPNTNSPSQTPGKGVSEVSFLFPTSFDPNNADPCYVTTTSGGAISRGKCDDNLALTTRAFGGEVLVPSQNHIVGPLTPDVAATFTATTFEVQAGATLYDLVTDQLAEVTYLAANCDPGVNSNAYHPVNPCPAATTVSAAALSGTPPQETDFGSGVIAQLFPSLNGGSSALIILPPGATPTVFATAVQTGYVAATGTVTAGQTVGFLWRLRIDANATTGTYNLTCFMVDAATQATKVAFPTGLSCQVPATVTLPTDIPVYIVTTGTLYGMNSSGWKLGGGIAFATLLVPFLLFRRRLNATKQLVVLALLSFAGAMGLSGCGAGGVLSSSSNAVAPGTYWFRVSATPTAGGTTITSTAFSVKVVAGN